MKRLFVCLIFLIGFSYVGAANAAEYKVGVRAKSGIEEAKQRWQPTLDYLGRQIPNAHFVMVPVVSLDELTRIASDKKLDFVLTNPSSYIEIKNRYDAQALVTLLNKRGKAGHAQFGSVIFTLAKYKDIKTLADIKGRILTAVSEPAFGGWRVAWNEMVQAGINPYKDTKQLIFADGIQEKAVQNVINGVAQVGVVRTDQLERMAARREIDLRYIRVLNSKDQPDFPYFLSTRLYPEWPFAALSHVTPELRFAVKKALLEIEEQDKVAVRGQYVGWIEPLDYSPVNTLLESLSVGPYLDSRFYKELAYVFSLVGLSLIFMFRGGAILKLVFETLWASAIRIYSVYSIGAQIAFLVTVIVTLTAVSSTLILHNNNNQTLAAHTLEDLSIQVEKSAQIIAQKIDAIKTDVAVIEHISIMKRYIESFDQDDNASARSELEDLLRHFLVGNDDYISLRFIDVLGKERIKVARYQGRVHIVPQQQMQDKRNRGYIVNALATNSNDIQLSEINLNREYGKIEIPYKPVIRVSKLITDESKNIVVGILVANIDIGKSLRLLEKLYDNAHISFFLTNDHGDYLVHPNKDKVFGFDLQKQFRIQEDYPELSTLFLPGENVNRIILFEDTRYSQRPVVFSKVQLNKGQSYPFITVGLERDFSDIVSRHGEGNGILYTAFGILVLGLLAGNYLARVIVRPIRQTTEGVQAYMEGKEVKDLPRARRDESGILAEAFVKLIKQIESNEKELKQFNTELIQSVDSTERRLNDTEIKYKTILDTISEAVITVDEAGKIESLNRSATDMLKHHGDLIGKGVDNVLSNFPIHYLRKNNITHKALMSSNHGIIDTEVYVTGMTLQDHKYFNISIRDITERKKLYDDMLLAKEEAEKANRAKSEFLSRMSHELRTPLNAILGFSQLLELESLNEEQIQMVEEILLAGTHLLDLINEVLDLARIESGRLNIKKQPVDLNRVLGESARLVKSLLQSHENSLIMLGDPKQWVEGDPTRIKQILLNFLSNAIKYGKSGEDIYIACINKGDKVRIEVHDQGEGLKEDDIEKLFQPFERLNNSLEGTGIGLVISKHLAELMGGRIGVESTKNKGSVFWVELGESQEKMVDDGKAVKKVGLDKLLNENYGKVLYIEDDSANVLVLQQLLSGINVDFLHASTADAGMNILRDHEPDVILLDLNLPDMHGLDFMRKMLCVGKRVPIIVISADVMSGAEEEATRLGAKAFLTKPVSFPELLKCLEKLLPKLQKKLA